MSFTICPTPYNRKYNVLRASLNILLTEYITPNTPPADTPRPATLDTDTAVMPGLSQISLNKCKNLIMEKTQYFKLAPSNSRPNTVILFRKPETFLLEKQN